MLSTQPINLGLNINWARFSSTFIIEVTRGKNVFTSTAVAIGPKLLLTAAHCVDCTDKIRVLIGSDYLNPDNEVQVDHCIVHPGYNPSKSYYENDIAVIYLEENLPAFSFYEELETDLMLDANTKLQRIGFGGRNSKNIRTWTNPSYQSVTFNKKNYVLNDELSVIGDSGGPIYAEFNGVLKLVALHSTLEGEGKTYAVNLSSYTDWLEDLIDISKVV